MSEREIVVVVDRGRAGRRGRGGYGGCGRDMFRRPLKTVQKLQPGLYSVLFVFICFYMCSLVLYDFQIKAYKNL